MRNSNFIYGNNFDAKIMSSMSYKDALEYKNMCAKALTKALVKESAMNTDWHRLNTVAKAIKFNEALIKEAEGKD